MWADLLVFGEIPVEMQGIGEISVDIVVICRNLGRIWEKYKEMQNIGWKCARYRSICPNLQVFSSFYQINRA